MQWTGQKVMFDLRSQIFRHLQRMHIGFYDKNPVGRLVTRVTTDVDALNEMFTAGVVSIFEDVFVLVGIVAIMLQHELEAGADHLRGAAGDLLCDHDLPRQGARFLPAHSRRHRAHQLPTCRKHVSGMVVLQLFNREKRAFEQFSESQRAAHGGVQRRDHGVRGLLPGGGNSVGDCDRVRIWFGGGNQHGAFAEGDAPDVSGVLVAFMQYAQRFFRPIQDLSEKYNILQSAMASSERIFKLLDTPVDIDVAGGHEDADGPGRIEFDHVWFAYREMPAADVRRAASSGGPAKVRSPAATRAAGEPDWVLRDVSASPSSRAKRSPSSDTRARARPRIISLLMRFYDVQKGAIRIDGVDIKDMDLNDLRRRFGVVLQDPFLFTGTVGGNIRLGSDWIADETWRRPPKT